ncbi:hypothetical protein BASA60_004727 [Batrachochytrium salamandrivorans]|nr:hypothetical protein BASA60_004727 [Batrachochytrium salamandrivorans]
MPRGGSMTLFRLADAAGAFWRTLLQIETLSSPLKTASSQHWPLFPDVKTVSLWWSFIAHHWYRLTPESACVQISELCMRGGFVLL